MGSTGLAASETRVLWGFCAALAGIEIAEVLGIEITLTPLVKKMS